MYPYRPVTPQIRPREPKQHYKLAHLQKPQSFPPLISVKNPIHPTIKKTFFARLMSTGDKDMSGYGQVLHGGCTMILSKKKLGGVSLSFLQTRSGREVVLETESIEARGFTSEQLGNEVGLDCSGRTVQRAMGTMSYHKCQRTACGASCSIRKHNVAALSWAERLTTG